MKCGNEPCYPLEEEHYEKQETAKANACSVPQMSEASVAGGIECGVLGAIGRTRAFTLRELGSC